LEFLEIMEIWW